MKPVSEVIACVAEYGTFESLALKLSETFQKVYYHTPVGLEYMKLEECVIGDGLADGEHRIERLDEILDPDVLDSIDLFIFPDIGWDGLQRYLRSQGKAVWGSFGADVFELSRTKFLEMLKKMDLPAISSVKIKGLTNLRLHLKNVNDKWIKINRYRGDMETWHHLDWQHSQSQLDGLSVKFGGLQEFLIFLVQDCIPTEIETGYDGWFVDGQFPIRSFQGYEKKNELYLAALIDQDDLPEPVREVNDRITPILKDFGYQNFIATEIRVLDGVPYFIDPTFRMPGQSGEHLLESCTNLAKVIWHGANGQMIEPEFSNLFAVEATLHHADGADNWKVLKIPGHIQQYFKGVYYCKADGLYHFTPGKNDEVGVMLGLGDSIEEALEHLQENMEVIKDQPVHADIAGFADLLKEAQAAKEEGIPLTGQPIPEPAIVLEDL